MSMALEGKLAASKGKFKVIGVDTFEGPTEDYLIGEYDNQVQAASIADEKVGDMNPTYVYNDKGKLVHQGKKK